MSSLLPGFFSANSGLPSVARGEGAQVRENEVPCTNVTTTAIPFARCPGSFCCGGPRLEAAIMLAYPI